MRGGHGVQRYLSDGGAITGEGMGGSGGGSSVPWRCVRGRKLAGWGEGYRPLPGCVVREGGRLVVTSAIARGERGVSGAVGRDNVPAVGMLSGGWEGVRVSVSVCVNGMQGPQCPCPGRDPPPLSRRAEHGEGRRLHSAAAGRAAVPAGPERGHMQRPAGGVPAAAGGAGHGAGVPARRARRGQARHQPEELR